jgi:hypothetical protein
MTLRTRRPASHPVGEAAADASSASSPESTSEIAPAAAVAKKLPRVILKVGPRPET